MQITKNYRIENWTSYDIIIALLIIGVLAFGDIDIICLGFQALAIAYTGFRVLGRRYMVKDNFEIVVWVIVVASYMCLSSIWASTINDTLIPTSFAFIQSGIILYCILEYCTDSIRMTRLIRILEISALVISLRFVISVPVAYWGTIRSTVNTGIFSNNDTAMTLSFISTIILWEVVEGIRPLTRQRIIGFVYISIFMFIVLMMGTKKGLVIFGIGAISLYLYKSKNVVQSVIRIIIIYVVLLILYYFLLNNNFLYEIIGNRVELMISGFLGGNTDKSTATRLLFAQNAFDEFENHPFIGIGQDGFRYVNKYQFTYSHNNYVELLANLGIIGFCMYYWIYAKLLNASFKIIKNNILPFVLLITLVVVDLSSVSYSSESKGIWLGIIMGFGHLYTAFRHSYDTNYNAIK